jgi:acyl-CoA dehydrogenase
MRAIGMAELCLELHGGSLPRAACTFGKHLFEHGSDQAEWMARSRIEIEQARLLVLKTAALIDERSVPGPRARKSR